MRRIVLAVLTAAATTAACNGPSRSPNPIDRVLAPRFEREKITPVAASSEELCRRLGGDLLGRFPTLSESQKCELATPEQVAKDFQRTKDYRMVAWRHWRDRLETNDVYSDWRYLKDLFGKIDDLHTGRLGYRDFAIETMSHPGFVLSHEGALATARGSFRAFAGREATDAEAADFAALWRPWVVTDGPDPDFPYVEYRAGAAIEPFLCVTAEACSSTLYGGGSIDLSALADSDEIPWEQLSGSQIHALQEPGRVLTAQPFFWEAEADEILNRLLGWSDGGRFPREPGIVLPEVREVLADFLRETGDVPAAERMVIGSWLYRMKANVGDDGYGADPGAPIPAVYTSGPVKPVLPEVWLKSAESLLGDFSTCDPRYPDLFGYFMILDAVEIGAVDIDTARADTKRLYEMQDYAGAFDEEEGIPGLPFVEIAQFLGGCPGLEAPRREPAGLAYAFAQEAIAEELCSEVETGDDTVSGALADQMPLLLGREPSDADVADFEAAAAQCEGAECGGAGIRSGVCVGLLGGIEMNFY